MKLADNMYAEMIESAGETPVGYKTWEFVSNKDSNGNGAHWIEPSYKADERRVGHFGIAGSVEHFKQ
ncbi:MAG: hypothetical protein ACYC0M_10830 [Burkholderiales bacterium]